MGPHGELSHASFLELPLAPLQPLLAPLHFCLPLSVLSGVPAPLRPPATYRAVDVEPDLVGGAVLGLLQLPKDSSVD
jgi:hypothetical protein